MIKVKLNYGSVILFSKNVQRLDTLVWSFNWVTLKLFPMDDDPHTKKEQ